MRSLKALHPWLAPLWTGLVYGVAFTFPVAVAILGPRWRPDGDDGGRQEPRWIPRLLQRRIRLVQAGGLIALAGAAAVLLNTGMKGI